MAATNLPVAGSGQNLRVFISYARSDGSFVQELAGGLELARFQVLLDQHSILEGEDWKARLGALIAEADTIVFVISPESIGSQMCLWEIHEAQHRAKRILPVLLQSSDATPVPQELAVLNYVRFDEGRSFVAGLTALVRALNTDIEWIREHTRLFSRAMEWDAASRQPNRMLLGDDIAAAKDWAANRPKTAPIPTDLHLEYIKASELADELRHNAERLQIEAIAKAQTAQAAALADRETAVRALSRRTTIGLVATGGLTLAASGLAYWGVDAERRFRAARANSREETIKAEASREDIAGQFMAYAAATGTFAAEGAPGGNSPYTGTVLKTLSDRSVSVYEGLFRAHETVRTRSATKQRPYLSTDMNGEIYLQRQPPTRIRRAVIVSNDMFINRGQLSNVHNDARDWATFLHDKCEFSVQQLKNPGKNELSEALSKPLDISPPHNSLYMLVYAGFGITIDGEGYINTNDADHSNVDGLSAAMLSLSAISNLFRDHSAASIMILDTNFPTLDTLKKHGWWPSPLR